MLDAATVIGGAQVAVLCGIFLKMGRFEATLREFARRLAKLEAGK